MSAIRGVLRFCEQFGMRRIQVKQLDYDLTPLTGLSLVGHSLRSVLPQFDALDAALPLRTGVRNSDVLRAYLGLLVWCKARAPLMPSRPSEATPSSNSHWASNCCPPAPRCASAWLREPQRCSSTCPA